jgi:hypothetical protein
MSDSRKKLRDDTGFCGRLAQDGGWRTVGGLSAALKKSTQRHRRCKRFIPREYRDNHHFLIGPKIHAMIGQPTYFPSRQQLRAQSIESLAQPHLPLATAVAAPTLERAAMDGSNLADATERPAS